MFRIYSGRYLKFLNISGSGSKVNRVPLRIPESSIGASSINSPRLNTARLIFPSLIDSTLKYSDSALTAFVPTPLSPTDFLNALESYFPPVFIFDTQSTTLPKGIPRP